MDYCGIEWFALETNRDHSVAFEIASSYCILACFVLILLCYIVGVGLVRPFTVIRYRAPLQRLVRRALSVYLLMSMSEAFSVPCYTLIKLCYTKAFLGEGEVLVLEGFVGLHGTVQFQHYWLGIDLDYCDIE